MKLKIKYTLFLFFSLLCTLYLSAQQVGLKSYENDYFQLEYPENWNLSGRPTFVKIAIPDATFDKASIDIGIEKSNMMSPPIVEAMMGDLEVLHYEGADKFITDMEYSMVKLDEEVGFFINKSDSKRTYLKYVFVLEEELTIVKIWVKTGKDSYTKFESKINQILASIKFKDRSKETKRAVVEATEKEFTEDWILQEARLPGPSNDLKITKLDSLLLNLKSPTYGFKITDLGIEINNWADFFAWKPQTALKDYQIFAFQDWPGECLTIFRMYMHLGEYDNLRIQEMPEKQLEFLFSKQDGHTIRWVLEYAEEHQFPLNEDIALERFIYTTTLGYRRKKDGKRGPHVPFLINDKVYRVKVENLSVF